MCTFTFESMHFIFDGASAKFSTNSHETDYTGSALLYTVKKVSDFPVPSRDVTNQTLPGLEK